AGPVDVPGPGLVAILSQFAIPAPIIADLIAGAAKLKSLHDAYVDDIGPKLQQFFPALQRNLVLPGIAVSPASPPGFPFTVQQGSPDPVGAITITNTGVAGSML